MQGYVINVLKGPLLFHRTNFLLEHLRYLCGGILEVIGMEHSQTLLKSR